MCIRDSLYLAPAILVMLIFVLYPLVKVFRMGFYTKYNYLTEVGKGFGLKAFEHVLGDPSFQLALKNTLIIFGAVSYTHLMRNKWHFFCVRLKKNGNLCKLVF